MIVLAQHPFKLGSEESDQVTGDRAHPLVGMSAEVPFLHNRFAPVVHEGVELEVSTAHGGFGASYGGGFESELGERGEERPSTGEQPSRQDRQEEMHQCEIGPDRHVDQDLFEQGLDTVDYG